jgi:hypothetical protein
MASFQHEFALQGCYVTACNSKQVSSSMRVLAASRDAVLQGNNSIPDLWPRDTRDVAAKPVAAAQTDKGARKVIKKRALLSPSTYNYFLIRYMSLCHNHCIMLLSSNCAIRA